MIRETSGEDLEASVLRSQLNDLQGDEEVDPEDLWEFAEAHNYSVTLSPSDQGQFDVEFLDIAQTGQIAKVPLAPPSLPKPWSVYANDPLENRLDQDLIPQLREYLTERLPEYMIPAAWMVLKQLPLTPNGKVDRRALPVPLGRPEGLGEYVAPSTVLQSSLAHIWAQVLQVDQVGLKDNFFEIGGHSLLGMKLVGNIAEQFGIRLSVVAIFKFPTVELMAEALESLQADPARPKNAKETEFDEGII